MTTPLRHLHGHFYFADLHTSDVDAACALYGELLGWSFQEMPGAPNRYVTAAVEGRPKAAITGLTGEQRAAGVAPYWFPYLYVADIDATCARVHELGGVVEHDPYDVFDLGRMAVATDPTGASFGIWQDLQPEATTVKDEHGSPFWYELHTRDVDAARSFYGGLVGWDTDPIAMGESITYHLLVAPEAEQLQRNPGAMMGLMQEERAADAASSWAVYFHVDDADATWARALELGARSVMEPHDVPGAGRSSWLADPQGATFAAMTPTPPE